MKTQRTMATLAATLITYGSLLGGANAAVTFTFREDGNDVVADLSGSFSSSLISGLSIPTGIFMTDGFNLQGLSRDDLPNATIRETDFFNPGSPTLSLNINSIVEVPLGQTITIDPLSQASVGFRFGRIHVFNNAINGGLVEGTGSYRLLNTDLDSIFTAASGLRGAGTVLTVGSINLDPFNTSNTTALINFTSIPEPTSSILLGLGVISFAARRRRTL